MNYESMTKLNFYELDEEKRLCWFRSQWHGHACTPEYALRKMREDIEILEEFQRKDLARYEKEEQRRVAN